MDSYDPREGIKYAEASKRWASLAILIVVIGLLVLLWWFIDSYYGPDGVRVVGMVIGLGLLVLFVIGVGYGVQAISTSLSQRHHDNVLRGLVAFQREDDRGEVARTVASGMAGVLKSGNQLDRTVLTMAGRLGQQQAQAMVRGQLADQQRLAQQQTEQQAQSWYDVPAQFEDDTSLPPGW
jgi:hypothetical protein